MYPRYAFIEGDVPARHQGQETAGLHRPAGRLGAKAQGQSDPIPRCFRTEKVTMEFSRPGKPSDNAHIESFNGRFRDKCLNGHWFTDLTEAKRVIESCRRDYNESRPHKALNQLTPREYAEQLVSSVWYCPVG